MAKIDFYKIDKTEKAAIFNEIATKKGMKPFAVEKRLVGKSHFGNHLSNAYCKVFGF